MIIGKAQTFQILETHSETETATHCLLDVDASLIETQSGMSHCMGLVREQVVMLRDPWHIDIPDSDSMFMTGSKRGSSPLDFTPMLTRHQVTENIVACIALCIDNVVDLNNV